MFHKIFTYVLTTICSGKCCAVLLQIDKTVENNEILTGR
jgi:hypothetical protein